MKKTLKKIIEEIMYYLFATPIDKIYKKIDKYEYVSFDIFDTLIKRDTLLPEDVFNIIEKESNIKNFKNKRVLAQKKARLNTDKEEITINEIYQCFEGISKDEKDKLMRLELDIEKRVCKQNNDIYIIYQYCLKNNKKIYIISDMYLPLKTIKEILMENDYKDYDKLLLSSDLMCTKKSGDIFKKALENNNVLKGKIIHIGDHPLSDFINPRRYGIKSILISK